MLEKTFQSQVIDLARKCGCWVYHTYDSRRSVPGFPDLVIVGREGTLFRELKTERGRTSPEQRFWLAMLTDAGQDAAVWRPSAWPDRIHAELQALGRVRVQPPLPSQAEVRKMLQSRVSGNNKFPSGS